MENNFSSIEKKWKKYWKENNTYQVKNNIDLPKFYVLDMFPYPSGSGLHVGHPLGYIASDIYSRFKTMTGFNVLHPMGFDAFGLPAEQYAIQTGVHPAKSTADNIAMYKKQLENIGFNYDWSRSVNTSEPKFYKWTQWIFSQLFNHYYDLESNSAKDISLLIDHLNNKGTEGLTAYNPEEVNLSADSWKAMSDAEKAAVLMNFRLAYRNTSYVNYCEALGTVLANDEVKDGLSERGGFPVERKAMVQWSLRITAFAERLLEGLKTVEWSESLKAIQRNWIGKSTGAQVLFNIKGSDKKIEVFTTRPDTIFGSSFLVLAPELELVNEITTPDQQKVIEDYQSKAASKSERERMSEVKEVSGAFTGAYAIHPFTNAEIPIWISDYVLKDYGTGAIMAVPSDDERDMVFAQKFDLPIIDVVDKSDFPNATLANKLGTMINSDFLNGLPVKKAIKLAIHRLEELGIGQRKVNFKLRDANFSRQRYWGEPFPIIFHEDGTTENLDITELPVELPDLSNFKPAIGGQSPLARLDDWVNTPKGKRETDTMPGYAGSSWYFLRYMDAQNDDEFASKKALDYWQDVDLYIGGTEHAVGHLMYSRFWHKFLYDINKVPTQEPFKKLINQGMIQGVIESIYLAKEKDGDQQVFYSSELVENVDDFTQYPVHIDFVVDYGAEESYLNAESIRKFVEWRPEFKDAVFVDKNGRHTASSGDVIHLSTVSEVGKMSKRYYNVVNPDDVVSEYGADCFRMYEMFLGPIEQSKPWDTKGIDGVAKFIRKYWSLFYDQDGNLMIEDGEPKKEDLKTLHKTIKKVRQDIERFSFNTCVSAFMIAVNDFKKSKCHNKSILRELTLLLAPFAPFITEELWKDLGEDPSIHHAAYPEFDASKLLESEIHYPVSFNGKKKFMTTFPAEYTKEQIEKALPELDELTKYLDGKIMKKVIVVPGRIINIIV